MSPGKERPEQLRSFGCAGEPQCGRIDIDNAQERTRNRRNAKATTAKLVGHRNISRAAGQLYWLANVDRYLNLSSERM